MRRLLTVWLLCAGPALAQCTMCREAAASQDQQAVAALNAGILTLGAPVLAAFVGLGALLRSFARRENATLENWNREVVTNKPPEPRP